ncbi:MAG TPA: lipid A export permease/ATP-binding protein MsbA [Candidatus Saccharimonadia bacterium]|nr:lipid A export permease/ATP-binding protein MsbA [Candidatus Saccharimonadia bacterium]
MSVDANKMPAGVVYRRLLRYALPSWPIGVVAALGMLLEAAAAGAFTWLMQPMIDGTFIERDPDVIAWLPFAVVAIFLVRGVATFVSDVGMARIGRGVVRDLREEVLSKYLRLPSSFFDREPSATLVARLSYNTEQVSQSVTEAVKVIVTDALTLVALLVVMLMQSVKLTATMLIMGPVIAGIVHFVGRRYRRINQRIQTSVAEMSHAGEQAIAAQDSVKIYGGQGYEVSRFVEIARRNLRLHLKVESTKALASSIVQLLAAAALAIIVYIAGREAVQDKLTAGMFMALITAMMAMLPSLKRLTNVQSMIQRGVAAGSSLFVMLDAPEERDDGTRPIARARGRIEFRDVAMRYRDDVPALEGVSFVAEPGSVTAIVGRSGSGKSTLVQLVPRLYEPGAGLVLLDDEPVDAYRLADLRRQIAVVGQKVTLFDDTVARNIAYGALAGASPAQIEAAARAANALEFIERLPQGFDTPIGDNGALLSGGQRQRLAIARAILKDAPILILDEATSSLDPESERLISDALEKLLHRCTTLVIAHRLATVEHADQVLVLERGRLIERGRHAELLARDGHYAYLHRMQLREPAPGDGSERNLRADA